MSTSSNPRDFRNLKQWLPPTSLHGLKHEINELFEGFFQETLPAWRGDAPRVDVVETPQAVEVSMDLPGWTAEEVELDVGENYLTISGKHVEEVRAENGVSDERRFHRVERRAGNFSRSIWLPCPVNAEMVDAQLVSGVLKVRLPKRTECHRRQIKVRPAGSATPPQECG